MIDHQIDRMPPAKMNIRPSVKPLIRGILTMLPTSCQIRNPSVCFNRGYRLDYWLLLIRP